MSESSAPERTRAQVVARWLLLGFIGVAVAAMVIQEVRGRSAGPVPAPESGEVVGNEAGGPDAEQRHVVVYYFHGNFRCATCTTIEAYARESVAGVEGPEGVFANELQVVNVDEPANRHFVADYKLETRTVVVAEFKGGRQVRYKKLDGVWDRVRDKEAFISYVRQEIGQYLNEPGEAAKPEAGA